MELWTRYCAAYRELYYLAIERVAPVRWLMDVVMMPGSPVWRTCAELRLAP